MKIAIQVGHFGKGTGVSYEGHDEWTYALLDADNLCKMLSAKGHKCIMPFVDKDSERDRSYGMLLAEKGGLKDTNHAIRCNWSIMWGADLVLELHYNGAGDTRARGHEVLIDNDEPVGSQSEKLATAINNKLTMAFPLHPDRGVKRSQLKVTEILRRAVIPCCLIEPCFIFEDLLSDRRLFTGPYYTAVVDAIEEYGKTTA